MKKYKKISTVILLVAIMLLHTVTMALAATTDTFSLTLPNQQEVKTLGKGTKGTNDLYSKVKVTGGNVNYIYASAYNGSNNITEDVEVMISNGASEPTKLWYSDSYSNITKGKSITIKAYQKNVRARTASGDLVY